MNFQLFISQGKCFHTEIWHSLSQAEWYGFPFSIKKKKKDFLAAFCFQGGVFLVGLCVFCSPLERLDTWKKTNFPGS